MERLSRRITLFLSLVFILITFVSGAHSQDSLIPPPPALVALSNHNSQIPLYWFPPGTSPTELSHDDGVSEVYGYVGTEWKDNKISVRYKVDDYLPCLLSSFKIYFVNQDLTQYPGDRYSPIQVSVNRDSSGLPGRIMWGPTQVQADSSGWVNNGQWLEVPCNLFLLDDSIFWIVLHWLPETPTAPLIGKDTTSVNQQSWWAQFNGEILEWHLETGHNFMVRASVVSSSNLLAQSVTVDSFNLYRSTQPGDIFSPSNRLQAMSSSSYSHMDAEVSNGVSYYYALTSVLEGNESPPQFSQAATPRSGANLILSRNSNSVEIAADSVFFDTIQIYNAGDLSASLQYQIKLTDSLDHQLSDNWGYTWKSSLNSPEVAFKWIDIEDESTLIAQSVGDDNNWGPYTLAFSFPFYGKTFDSLRICSNGFLSFTSPSFDRNNVTLPNSGGEFNLIAPFWDDLSFVAETKVYFRSWQDTAVVTFSKISSYPNEGSFTFQIILSGHGNIRFQYLDMSGPVNSATIGVQNCNGTDGLPIAHNEDFAQDSLAVLIPESWLQPESSAYKLLPGETKDLILRYSSKDLGEARFFGKLIVNGEDSTGPLVAQEFRLILDVTSPTPVKDGSQPSLPFDFQLRQNYPNPFNQKTTISYSLTNSGQVTLKIFNLRGELVKTLVHQFQPAGVHGVTWDGTNDRGEAVASGIYFYQLLTRDFRQARKLTLLK